MKPVIDPAVSIPVVPIRSKRKRQFYAFFPNVLQKAIWLPLRPLFKFFLHIRIEGLEYVRDIPPGIIFASNHSSEFDPILIPSAMPFLSKHIPFFYLSRGKDSYTHLGWYAKVFYGGLFFKLWGAYPVEAGSRDYSISLKTHAQFLTEGHSVCVFPEGKMQRDGVIAKARGGVSYLSWITGRPIVPVAILGVANMGMFDVLTGRRSVTIRFNKPLYPKELFAHLAGGPVVNEEKNDFTETAQDIMQKIRSSLVR